MFITKKKLTKMLDDAKSEAVIEERERHALYEELNGLRRYISEVLQMQHKRFYSTKHQDSPSLQSLYLPFPRQRRLSTSSPYR